MVKKRKKRSYKQVQFEFDEKKNSEKKKKKSNMHINHIQLYESDPFLPIMSLMENEKRKWILYNKRRFIHHLDEKEKPKYKWCYHC